MAVLRKIALALLLAASAGVLLMAAWELYNYRQFAYLPLQESGFASGGDRARILQNHMDLMTKRVGDMELLILILLGTSGLYAIVFVASSYFSATSFARQADQTIGHIQDQIGLAMGDLRELQEETEQRLHQMTAAPVAAPKLTIQSQAPPEPPATGWLSEVTEMAARLNAWQTLIWQDVPLGEEARLELVQDENSAAHLEVAAGVKAGSGMCSALAGLYLGFGRIYASFDRARSRFYLERALRLATQESPLASEIHYQLACHFAASHHLPVALRELGAAFEHQFKTLEERLASDIEEGGRLYDLASTAPFDKAVNDLLLNISIGIG
ncbi:MAG TPA: hypothetical protein VK686_20005 [Bryobacteraceae bacterium]|nr:hypothetical protein [Bryobacteraceae bacterium]